MVSAVLGAGTSQTSVKETQPTPSPSRWAHCQGGPSPAGLAPVWAADNDRFCPEVFKWTRPRPMLGPAGQPIGSRGRDQREHLQSRLCSLRHLWLLIIAETEPQIAILQSNLCIFC